MISSINVTHGSSIALAMHMYAHIRKRVNFYAHLSFAYAYVHMCIL